MLLQDAPVPRRAAAIARGAAAAGAAGDSGALAPLLAFWDPETVECICSKSPDKRAEGFAALLQRLQHEEQLRQQQQRKTLQQKQQQKGAERCFPAASVAGCTLSVAEENAASTFALLRMLKNLLSCWCQPTLLLVLLLLLLLLPLLFLLLLLLQRTCFHLNSFSGLWRWACREPSRTKPSKCNPYDLMS